MKISIAIITALVVIAACSNESESTVSFKAEGTKLHNGDIIFQISTSSQSKAIQLATHSKYSHMGIVYEQNNQFLVYEAVQTVKLTPLDSWIQRREGEHYVVKRLIKPNKVLSTYQKLIHSTRPLQHFNGPANHLIIEIVMGYHAYFPGIERYGIYIVVLQV